MLAWDWAMSWVVWEAREQQISSFSLIPHRSEKGKYVCFLLATHQLRIFTPRLQSAILFPLSSPLDSDQKPDVYTHLLPFGSDAT